MLANNGIFCAAIDDVEVANLRQLLQSIFGKENELGIVAVCSHTSGRPTPTGFASAHEYALFFGMMQDAQAGHVEWTKEQLNSYKEIDSQGRRFRWVSLRNDSGGPNKLRENRPRLFYPLFVTSSDVRIPKMEWNDGSRQWKLLESPGTR